MPAPPRLQEARWQIFCRVVDNFGDAGVCWRLARQLADEYRLPVDFWVDDLATLKALLPPIDLERDVQFVEAVRVRRWEAASAPSGPSQVVIEAFACNLPAAFLEAMAGQAQSPVWINLEYLSAESWVESCHGLPSPHPGLPLVKHFFFPGFTEASGGLLREAPLLARREAFVSTLPPHDALEISLFCYHDAPVKSLLEIWQASERPIRCHVPPGQPLQAVAAAFGGCGPWRRGSLEILPLPFLSQTDYDRLLWRCDINFVRGEDSFVRAQWAGKPFFWQIYPQDENAHLAKLDAFLERYCAHAGTDLARVLRDFFRAWNTGQALKPHWAAFIARQKEAEAHARRWAETLSTQTDLAARLVGFCKERYNSRFFSPLGPHL